MQVKDFFGDFSTKINLLYKEKNTDLDLLSRIEVKVTLSKLKELLDQYDKQNSEVSYLSLKPLFDFLADRWRYLKRTNATYFLKPNSAVNRGCCLLAEKLSSQFNIPIKDILMPSVAAKQNEKKYYQWRWHEFILDKNGDPFSIQACLSYSEEYKKSFLYQPVKKTILHNDTEERALVINHSEEAKKYYNAIRDFTVHGNNQERDLIAARDAFNQKIISDEYKVTASYGEAGENRLMDFLLKDCKNLHDLIQFLMTYVAMNNWKDFVKKIEDTKLIGLVKGKQVFLTDIVTAQSTYKKNNEIYNKAALLFLSEIYWRERNKKADYIGGVGPFRSASTSWLPKKFWVSH